MVRNFACLYVGQTPRDEGALRACITGVKFTLNFTHGLSKPLVKAILSQYCTTQKSSLQQPSSLSIAQWGGTEPPTGLLQVNHVGGHSTPLYMQSWQALHKAIPALLMGVNLEGLWCPMAVHVVMLV